MSAEFEGCLRSGLFTTEADEILSMPNPDYFIEHLRNFGYHPRSDKHSNALGEAVVRDLLVRCPAIRERAEIGALVYWLNFTIRSGPSDWNIDLVLGRPEHGSTPSAVQGPMICQLPATVEIALEFKATMTEHRKAIRNRKRDFEAHWQHVTHYSRRAIVGGILVINAAERFRSPLRREGEVTVHDNPQSLVDVCMRQVRAVTQRRSLSESGMDALAALVVELDNEGSVPVQYVTRSPAPQVGDPLHYDAFIHRICELYGERFAK